ncbi:MAG TPA: polysaccharide deacetylase family protein [Steroidobacteraceae bacterium]|nr:polysaccharide deacetylase family protein [Steroidobacteraceae bacterium]
MIETALLRWVAPAGRRGRLLIFTFHRVLAEPDPLLPDEPDARFFAQQMDWVRDYCCVLPLPEAVRRLADGSLPERAACITFDDGYANNYDVALPILKARNLPATIFIAVDAVRRGIMWNDFAIEALRRARPDADLSELGLPPGALAGAGASRAAAITSALEHLKYQPPGERWDRAQELFARMTGGASPPRLMMTDETVAKLTREGIDVGAHTVNHPILTAIPAAEARTEIEGSRRWVADVTGVAPKSFAYPNGRAGRDYDSAHVAMVRDAGFALAVSTDRGCATAATAQYELPRLAPWDRTARRFWMRLLQMYGASYAARQPGVMPAAGATSAMPPASRSPR